MKSFGLIFVLYNPSKKFLDNLVEARTACAKVIAVDNSPEANVRLHERLAGQGIQVIFNRNQGGLAGAYNRGAELLLAQACDVIFLMDQDSDIEKTFFIDMMEAADRLGTDAFLIGPKIFEIKRQRYMPVIPPGKYFPKPIRIDERAAGLFSTMCIISSGSAISAAAYRKLGAFREDYFIEYIDVEYSLRAISQNVPVYLNAAVTLRQSNGNVVQRGKLFSTRHVAWRRYYIARNMVHCLRLYRSICGMHWLSGWMAMHQALTVLLFDSQKLEKVTAIACGYLDGLFGRLGTFERRHRYLDTFCRRTERKGVTIDRSSSLIATGDEL